MKKETNDLKKYNEPSFSAQDAWKNMQEILDKEMPIENKRKKRFFYFWFITIIIAGVGTYLSLLPINTDKNKLSVIAQNSLDSTKYLKKTNTPNQTKIISEFSENKSPEKTYTNKNEIINNELANSDPVIKTISIKTKKNQENLKTITKTKIFLKKNSAGSINDKNVFLSNSTEIEYYTTSTPNVNVLKQVAAKINNKKTGLEEVTNNSFTNLQTRKNIIKINEEESNEEKNTLINSQSKISSKIPAIEANTAAIKVPKNKANNALHYGLQWNILLPQANNYLDYNAKNQPLSVIIPEFWVSKNLNNKSEIGLQLNPYSQYTLRNNNVLNSKDYLVTVLQGSNPTPTTTTYIQTRSLLKAMGVELTARYTYKLSDNFSVAIGIGNTWLNAAVVNDRVKSKDGKLSHDSLYGIAQGFNDWDYLKSSFIIGKFEMLYKFNRFQFGVSFVKPIGNIYSFSNSNSNPVNGRALLRWQIN